MPLPTAEEGPKTFEQLLAEKMEADQALSQGREHNQSDEMPKKQFLKRKNPTYVPPSKPKKT